MKNFSDLLNQPLPSSVFESTEDTTELDEDTVMEAEDFDDLFSLEEDCCKEDEDDSPLFDSEDDDDDELEDDDRDEDEDDDLESDLAKLTDDELDQLEQDISDSDIDDLAGDATPVDLTPEEEAEADELMSVAATTELIRSEMNPEDRAKFVESVDDIKRAVQEGFLLESDIDALYESVQPITEATWYATKQRIQLGKEARMKQLWTVAVQVSARAHNDPDYRKLQKVYKLKRLYRSRLEKKYNAEAKKRMRVYIARLKKSKSKPLNDLGKKVFK